MGAGRAGSLDHLLPRRDVAYAPVPEKETVKRLVLTDAMLTEVRTEEDHRRVSVARSAFAGTGTSTECAHSVQGLSYFLAVQSILS